MASIAERFRNHLLYPEFVQVKTCLMKHQFVCWVAGGAVRDLYLGREVSDFDLVTDCNTVNLKKIFPDALLVGEKFGVLKLVLKNGNYFDLTTFRQEADYVDGRRPSSVSASTPLQDALRRDFKINALFWDEENQKLIDEVGGVSDLQLNKLMAVGDPEVRFSEDYLRIVRLLRFAAQLNFQMDPLTFAAAKKLVGSVGKISGERIWAELKKISHTEQWNFILNNSLFADFVEVVFQQGFEKKFSLKISASEDLHLFYIISLIGHDKSKTNDSLSQKLHLSQSEKNLVESFWRVQNEFKNLSVETISLQAEKKPMLIDVMAYLVSQSEIDSEKFLKVQKILKLFPETLIGGDQIKGLIAPRLIGKALDEVRLKQFEGSIKTGQEALDYIKNHFARST